MNETKPKFEDMIGFKEIRREEKTKTRDYFEMILLFLKYTLDFMLEYAIPFLIIGAEIELLFEIIHYESGWVRIPNLIVLLALFYVIRVLKK